MAIIQLNSSLSMANAFESFLYFKTSQGVTDKTLQSYRSHFKSISKYLDTSINLSDLKREHIHLMILEMRQSNLSPNSIASYVRALKAFLSWSKNEGLCNITIPSYRTEETVKETYTDEELTLLLKKPNVNKVRFSEYRTWVIKFCYE